MFRLVLVAILASCLPSCIVQERRPVYVEPPRHEERHERREEHHEEHHDNHHDDHHDDHRE